MSLIWALSVGDRVFAQTTGFGTEVTWKTKTKQKIARLFPKVLLLLAVSAVRRAPCGYIFLRNNKTVSLEGGSHGTEYLTRSQ